MTHFLRKGVGLVEVVVGLAIFSAFFFSLSGLYIFYTKNLLFNSTRLQAIFLAEEVVEALRFIRLSSWDSISVLSQNETYYVAFNGTTWSATTTPQSPLSGFNRSFRVYHVSRDSNDNIALSGSDDPDTRRVEVTVSWTTNGVSRSLEAESYITSAFTNEP